MNIPYKSLKRVHVVPSLFQITMEAIIICSYQTIKVIKVVQTSQLAV